MRAADSERAAVYAAEASAFLGTDLETLIGVPAAIGAVANVLATEWWPGPEVVGRAARADAGSSSARSVSDRDGLVTIRLAVPQATLATVAHELAHALAGVEQGHDSVFRRAYLDVVRVTTNLRTSDRRRDLHEAQLSEAFDAFGLDVADRRWPDPTGFGNAIAL